MAVTTRLSTKGQLVLPKAVRKRHGWEAGEEFVIEDHGDHLVLRPRPPTGTRLPLEDLFGCLQHEGPAVPIEELDGAIAAARLSEDER